VHGRTELQLQIERASLDRQIGRNDDFILETDRLKLRRWRDGDEIAAASIYAKPEVMQYIPGGIWDLQRTAQVVSRMRALDDSQGYGFYPIVLKESGAIAGHAGLGRLEATPEIELAYVFDVPCWGRGLASEIAKAVLEYGFTTIGLDRIVAVAFTENLRSIGVMKRCGMSYCGLAQHFGREVVKYEARP